MKVGEIECVLDKNNNYINLCNVSWQSKYPSSNSSGHGNGIPGIQELLLQKKGKERNNYDYEYRRRILSNFSKIRI